jgi:ADP-heptose:LPS heptosyltransferase
MQPGTAMTEPSRLLLSGVKKIVVLRPNAVGDFIFSLPALHALKNAYPEAKITYIGKQWHADFLAGRPGPIDKVAVIPPCPGVGTAPDAAVEPEPVQRFVAAMRKEEFDLAVQIFGGGHYSNPFIKQFWAGLTIGMKAADATPVDRWVWYGQLQNRRLQMLEVAALVGANTWSMGRELHVTERDRQEASGLLPADSPKPLIIVQPGATDRRRHWPAERFAAVADRLASEGAMIAVNGTEQEAPTVRAVIERMRHPAIDLSGKLSLSALCGLLERATLLISNDTGPLHLALAIGTPSVGIYWLTNLFESGPLRQDIHRPALSVRMHCPVCGAENLKTRCDHDVSFVNDVPLEEVESIAMDLFSTTSGR